MQGVTLPYRLLLAVLCVALVLFFVPALFTVKGRAPVLTWAPGYWQLLPDIGLARIIPVAPAALTSPSTGAGPKSIREPAVNTPVRKY